MDDRSRFGSAQELVSVGGTQTNQTQNPVQPVNPLPVSPPVAQPSTPPPPVQVQYQPPPPVQATPPPPPQPVVPPAAPIMQQQGYVVIPAQEPEPLPPLPPQQQSPVDTTPPFPDLTASQQIGTSFTAPKKQETVEVKPFVVTPPQVRAAPPPPPESHVFKAHGSSLPRILLLCITSFAMLVAVLLGIKVVSGFLSAQQNTKVTLQYWGLMEDNNVMQPIIDEFEKLHPNIIVDYTKQDPTLYSKTVMTRIANGTGPDIFRYHASWLPELVPDLLPLSTDVISKSDFSTVYYPVIQNDVTVNGAIYGLPLDLDTLTLFVNQKIFQTNKAQVPTTWDEFLTTAKALTTRDANGKIQVAGAALGTFDNITHAPDIISLLLVQNGVDLTTITPASNASDALTFYTSFANSAGNVWDNTLDPSLLAFEEGKLAMYLGYSWDVFAIQTSSPTLSFATYPVPHLPGRNATIASYYVEGVSSKTLHPKEAMLFMNYLAHKDTLTNLYTSESKYRLFGEPYPRTDLQGQLQNLPLVYPFVSQASDASSTFFTSGTGDTGIDQTMVGLMGTAVNSMLGNTQAADAVSKLTTGVTQTLSQYSK